MEEAGDEYYNKKVEQFGHVMTIFKWATVACLLAALLVMSQID